MGVELPASSREVPGFPFAGRLVCVRRGGLLFGREQAVFIRVSPLRMEVDLRLFPLRLALFSWTGIQGLPTPA